MSEWKAHHVVPDVIDQVPTNIATVKYKSGVDAKLGNELTPTQVQHLPAVTWPVDERDPGLFTVMLVDPDAPNRQTHTFREWRHYHAANVPGCELSKGQVLAEYIGSAPPQGSGLHRYVWLIYKQSGPIDTQKETHLKANSGAGRGKFQASKWASSHGLHLFAGNFYQAQYDDLVPVIHSHLK